MPCGPVQAFDGFKAVKTSPPSITGHKSAGAGVTAGDAIAADRPPPDYPGITP